MENRNAEMTYAQIMQRYQSKPEQDEAEGYYFNGADTIQRKTRYAEDNGLGGVMIWEIGQDTFDDSSLLRAINVDRKCRLTNSLVV